MPQNPHPVFLKISVFYKQRKVLMTITLHPALRKFGVLAIVVFVAIVISYNFLGVTKNFPRAKFCHQTTYTQMSTNVRNEYSSLFS